MTTEMDDLKSQLRNSEGQSNLEVIDMVLVKYIMKKKAQETMSSVFSIHILSDLFLCFLVRHLIS